jgi:hypothetical protein
MNQLPFVQPEPSPSDRTSPFASAIAAEIVLASISSPRKRNLDWLDKQLQLLEPEIKDISWKAQWRLRTRYKKLSARGQNKPQIVAAIGRELLRFLWAIAVRVEARHSEVQRAA